MNRIRSFLFLVVLVAPSLATAQTHGWWQVPSVWVDAVTLPDNTALTIGTSNDLVCSHDGTNTTCTSATGDLVFDSTDTNDQIVMRLGTDTSATSVLIENNGGEDLLLIDGAGDVFVGPDALAFTFVDCAASAAAESSDVIAVTIACTDQMGDAVTIPIALKTRAVLSDATGLVSAGNFTIAENGAGALITSHVTSTYLEILTSTGGAATIDATDVGGASGASIILDIADAGNPGVIVLGSRTTLTFD